MFFLTLFVCMMFLAKTINNPRKKGGKKPKLSWQLATSSAQRNALHDACAVGHLDMALMLLEDAPGALHKCDKQGRSPLTFAVMNGHTLLASHLIHQRALVDQSDSSGNSPLHYAMAYGWQDMAKLLVDCGHDPNVQNKWRNSPVDVSLLKGHPAMASWYVAECPIQPDTSPLRMNVFCCFSLSPFFPRRNALFDPAHIFQILPIGFNLHILGHLWWKRPHLAHTRMQQFGNRNLAQCFDSPSDQTWSWCESSWCAGRFAHLSCRKCLYRA